MGRQSLKQKISLIIVPFVTVPLLTLGLFSYFEINSRTQSNSSLILNSSVENHLAFIEKDIESTTSHIHLLSQSNVLHRYLLEDDEYKKHYVLQVSLLREFKSYLDAHPEAKNIYLVDKNYSLDSFIGDIISRTKIEALFQNTKQNETIVKFNPDKNGDLSVFIGHPVLIQNNYVTSNAINYEHYGYLFVESTLNSVSKLKTLPIYNDQGGYLLVKGTKLLQGSNILNINNDVPEEIATALLANTNLNSLYEFHIIEKRHVVRLSRSKYDIAIAGVIPKHHLYRDSLYISIAVILAIIISILFSNFAILYSLRKFVIQPISSLSEFAQNIGDGDLESKINLKTADELEDLSSSMEEMRNKLLETLDSIEKSNAELDKALTKAEASNNSKSAFLANMSHEIRTPLNGIIGLTDILQESATDKSQKEYINLIKVSANHLMILISDILDLSKIEHGNISIKNTPGNLHKLIQELAGLYISNALEKNLDLNISVDPRIPEVLLFDEAKLRQILTNLVNNALKFTERGFIFIRTQILEQRGTGYLIRFSVKDSGIGIEQNKHDVIFDKFNQGDETTTRRYGGTGLGLAISRDLCIAMNSDMMLSSRPNSGSTFYFDLFLEKTSYTKEPKDLIGSLAKRPILSVVCDNKYFRSVYRKLADKLKLDLNQSYSSQEIYAQLVAGNRPDCDILILDTGIGLNSTYINLIKIVRRVESEKNTKPIGILIGAYNSNSHARNRLKNAGANIVVTRPILDIEVIRGIYVLADAIQNNKPLPSITEGMLYSSYDSHAISSYQNISGKEILIIEDNPVNQLITKKLVEKHGAIVTLSQNGRDGFDEYQKKKYDLILMDCQMPIMDGYEATKHIRDDETRQNKKHIPIIALTANAMSHDEDKCLEAGMDAYISKPLNQERFLKLVIETLKAQEKNAEQC